MDKTNYRQTEYNKPFIIQRADPYVYRHFDGTYWFTASVPECSSIRTILIGPRERRGKLRIKN